MSHVRQQIREAIAAEVTGLTTTGSNVHQSRIWNFEAGDLPCLSVFTNSETSETVSLGETMSRIMQVAVEGYVRQAADTDDTLDTVASEVEVAMASDQTFGGLARASELSGTEIAYSTEGERVVGVVTLTYQVQYYTASNAPDTAL